MALPRKKSPIITSLAALAVFTRYLEEPNPEPGPCFGPIAFADLQNLTRLLHPKR